MDTGSHGQIEVILMDNQEVQPITNGISDTKVLPLVIPSVRVTNLLFENSSETARMVHSRFISSIREKFGFQNDWSVLIEAERDIFSEKQINFTVGRGEIAETLVAMDRGVKLRLKLVSYDGRDQSISRRRHLVDVVLEQIQSERSNNEVLFKGEYVDLDGFMGDHILIPDFNMIIKASFSYMLNDSSDQAPPVASFLTPVAVNRKLLVEKLGCDVTIETKEGRVQCHKVFLIVHSEVWRAMFQTDCVEASTGTIKIDDMSVEGVQAMLSFLYCCDISAGEKSCGIALQLFSAGQRYMIEALLDSVKKLLLSKPNNWFNLEDLPQFYVLVQGMNEGRGDADLIRKLLSVIKSHGASVKSSTAFQEFFRSGSPFVLDLFANLNGF